MSERTRTLEVRNWRENTLQQSWRRNEPKLKKNKYIEKSQRTPKQTLYKQMSAYYIKTKDISDCLVGTVALVKGWIATVRAQKDAFISIYDGSEQKTFQIVFPCTDSDLLKRMTVGSFIEATGAITRSPGKGQSLEMLSTDVKVVGECPADYPLAGKKFHSLDYLRTIPEFRGQTALFRAITRVRHAMIMATHSFFSDRGFVNIHTPLITSSDCEGAGETFEVVTGYPEPFFKKSAYLTVSGQLQGEVAARSNGSIYTFGPTFRSEKSATTRHLAEFWMIEPEVAGIDYAGLRRLAEDYIKHCVSMALDCKDEMEFLDKYHRGESTTVGDTTTDQSQPTHSQRLVELVSQPFQQISYSDALALLAAKSTFTPLAFGDDLPSDQEMWLVSHFGRPVIVTHYPKSLKSFYMKETEGCDPDRKTVDCMDVLVPGIGELIGGSMREEIYDVLKQSMIDRKMDVSSLQWYLDLRKYGTFPHGGFGLGFERLIRLVTGMANIKDTIQFPTSYGTLF